MRRVLVVYLAVYFALLLGAIMTLWRSGVIVHLHRGWTYSAIVIAVGLGVLLWATSRR